MATWDDVRRIALALPGASERQRRGGVAAWEVAGRLFVWERPLGQKDLAALGDAAPTGPVLGARVEHLLAREAMIDNDRHVFFTIPHFEGYPAVLVRLDRITADELEEVVVEAWLNRAPKRLADAYLDDRGLAAE